MRQFQESISPKEGIHAGIQSNWDLWWLLQEYNGSDYNRFGNTIGCEGELWVDLGALATSIEAPKTILVAPGGAGDKSGTSSNHSRAIWKKRQFHWERCRCACQSQLLLIIQQFLDLMNSACILIYVSLDIYSYTSTLGISGLWLQTVLQSDSRCAWKWRSSEHTDTLQGCNWTSV
jgi:hypothetical protein